MIEIWVNMKYLVPLKNIYQISNSGKIRNRFTKDLIPVFPHRYVNVNIYLENGKRIQVGVHRLVAFNFIPNELNKPDVNHLNGDKHCNWDWNLEWCTKRENYDHAKRTKLYVRGTDVGISCLTDEQVHEICRYISDGCSNKAAIIKSGLQYTPKMRTRCSSIRRGETWKEISEKYEFKKASKLPRYSTDVIEKVCSLLSTNHSTGEILNEFGIKYGDINYNAFASLITKIRRGKIHRKISSKYNF